MRTLELIGPALEWAVAKCDGIGEVDKFGGVWVPMPNEPHFNEAYTPSTNWAQGGPIIEREEIDTLVEQRDLKIWAAEIYHSPKGYIRQRGATPLIAAMRCYVASKLGDNVDVPKELL